MIHTSGKIHHIHGLQESILWKWLYYQTQSIDSMPVKLPMAFFTELGQKTLKFVWIYKRPPNSQSNLEKEKQSWKNQASWLKTILQS